MLISGPFNFPTESSYINTLFYYKLRMLGNTWKKEFQEKPDNFKYTSKNCFYTISVKNIWNTKRFPRKSLIRLYKLPNHIASLHSCNKRSFENVTVFVWFVSRREVGGDSNATILPCSYCTNMRRRKSLKNRLCRQIWHWWRYFGFMSEAEEQ